MGYEYSSAQTPQNIMHQYNFLDQNPGGGESTSFQ